MRKWSALVAVPVVALAGLFGTAAAHARSDVQWSITLGTPIFAPPPAMYYAPPPVVLRPAPIYYAPRPYAYHYRPHKHHWDHDRDGIPNRYDRRYNPYGDRDRDGAPNRWDRNDRNPYRR
jgi:hypothetical protein